MSRIVSWTHSLLFLPFVVYGKEVPRRLSLGASNFISHSLGASCYVMKGYTDGLPCNPAMVAVDRDHEFQSQFFIGNNVSYVNEVSRILGGTAEKEDVQSLFSR